MPCNCNGGGTGPRNPALTLNAKSVADSINKSADSHKAKAIADKRSAILNKALKK